MNKIYAVHLSEAEQQQLIALTHKGSAPARVLNRARILLLSNEHYADLQIVQALQVSRPTVLRTRQRYVLKGLHAALYDQPRPGRPSLLNGEIEAQLTLLACSQPPDGRSHWTLQLLADRLVELGYLEQVSDVTIMHWLKKTN